jgi:hypothetical protein
MRAAVSKMQPCGDTGISGCGDLRALKDAMTIACNVLHHDKI